MVIYVYQTEIPKLSFPGVKKIMKFPLEALEQFCGLLSRKKSIFSQNAPPYLIHKKMISNKEQEIKKFDGHKLSKDHL